MEILVVTISDRASKGVYEDKSGPAVISVIREGFPDADLKYEIVPDDKQAILNCFAGNLHCDFILTTGGTGLGDRDVTPEVTEEFCDRIIPGIADTLRSESYRQTPNAMLSRGTAGQKGKTIIINLPGSPRGAEFCTRLLLPVIEHAPRMIRGENHG